MHHHYSCCLLVIFLLVVQISDVNAKGMWGSKRRREDRDDDSASTVSSGFEATRRRAAAVVKDTGVSSMSSGLSAGLGGSDTASTIATLFDTYLNMMDTVINSPDFDSLVTPESIKTIFDQVPGLSAIPEFGTIMDSPQFQDPATLKATIVEGVQSIRAYSAQIIALLNDPQQLSAMMAHLPDEVRTAVDAIMSGDMSAITGMLENLPIPPAQKKLALDLLQGNTDNIMDSVQGLLGDSSQVEAARQQFLENPEMAEMLGVPMSVLNDPRQFSALMKQGLSEMMSGGGDNDDSEESLSRRKRFAGASAA